MNDKSNILGSLMPRSLSGNTSQFVGTNGVDFNSRNKHQPPRPTSGASSATGKQHKLKQRFTVIRKLGKGTYGKVQLAINKETGQEVAIKTIKKTKIENEQDLQRVRREIQIMSSIEHPHIIHIYEVFENKDKIVLVMQYAPGGELYEYVSQSKILDDLEARRLFRQIALAIYYCHQNKICHRDLKLENILLDEKNNAKIADFGLSNVFDKRRQLRTFCGSPLYASPEIVQGSPYEGPEVDCWSLGVLLYTLVYGAMPFDGTNFKRLVKQISEACYYEPKQRSKASPLIGRLLCADPAKRATIIDICSDPWVNGTIPVSPRTPASEQPAQAHNSLLQVAQDMANLTPVRIDILLALAPNSPVLQPPEPNEPKERHPLSELQNVIADERPCSAMDLSIMEVDENRATSPIASYTVRDHVGPKLSEQQPPEQTLVQNEAETYADPVQAEADMRCEGIENMAPPESILEEEQQADAGLSATVSTTPATTTAVDETPNDLAPTKESELSNLKAAESKIGSDQTESLNTIDCKDREISMEVDNQQSVDETRASEETDHGVERKEVDTKQEKDLVEKPKKVKKKIIVKKKKRVSKKEPAENLDPSCTSNEQPMPSPSMEKPIEHQPTENQKQEVTKAPKTRGPGKIKIPNTFQATATESSPPKLIGLENRRQSTFVADVAQKLLQQSTNSNMGIKSEHPQLPSARVSDKKDEFERRASLAPTTESTVSRRGSQHNGPAMFEPEPADSRCDTISIDLVMEQAAVELILKQQSQEVDLKLSPHSEEPQKSEMPTGVASNSTRETNIERRLEESISRLTDQIADAKAGRKLSISLESNARDERSDSAETIRADVSPTQIRSSLNIDLKPLESAIEGDAGLTSQSADPLTSQMAIGPAPIARSYKKVTFTKDGTCITETGRIYATRGDDGTVRRVERKKKVTHYPANDGSSATKSISMTSTSEREQRFECNEAFPDLGHDFHNSFASSTRHHSRRPFEKLIMPMSGFSNQDNLEAGSQFKRQTDKQLRRADSASSCSSGSTDAFDDIFDTWTGASNMFRQNLNISELHDSLISRAFGDQILARSRFQASPHRRAGRGPGVSSSLAGTPRCESVEPQNLSCAHRGSEETRQRKGWTNSSKSGYDSEGPSERSASALGSTPCNSSPYDESLRAPTQRTSLEVSLGPLTDLERELNRSDHCLLNEVEQHHRNLKQRLAEHHRQLWKGSTPSLFANSTHAEQSPASARAQFPRHEKQGLWQFLRLQEPLDGANKRQVGSDFGHKSKPDLRQTPDLQHTAPVAGGTDLGQSQSSNSFLRQSIALDATPVRRNTSNFMGNLPPRHAQTVSKSTSKTSSLTSKISAMQLGPDANYKQEQQSASFIQLKRASSSSSSAKQSFKELVESDISSSKFIFGPGSSSMFAEGKVAPVTSPTETAGLNREQKANQSCPTQDNIDSRIQTWLQDSSGNLSSSSGSKSSASDMIRSGSKADPFTNLYGSLRSKASSNKYEQKEQLAGQSKTLQSSEEVQIGPSTSASVLMTTSSTVCESFDAQKSQREFCKIQSEVMNSDSKSTLLDGQLAKTSSLTKVSKATFKLRQKSPVTLDETEEENELVSETLKQHHEHQKETISTASSSLKGLPSTAPTNKNFDGLHWIQGLELGPSTVVDDLDDSLSAGKSGDLESRSSSSLLDQLRSRGYRSMVNQRMSSQLAEQQPAVKQTTIISTSVIESSSITSKTIKHGNQASSIGEDEPALEPKKGEDSIEIQDEDATKVLAETGLTTHGPQEKKLANGDLDTGSANLDFQNEADEADEADEDEDVREAKASIRSYRDRIKETEIFLNSMKQEEENLERHRQQLFLFNNLMSATRFNSVGQLNRFTDKTLTTADTLDSQNSLKFQNYNICSSDSIPNTMLNIEPTYITTPPSKYLTRRVPLEPLNLGLCNDIHRPLMSLSSPLEPVEPLTIHSNPSSWSATVYPCTASSGLLCRGRSRSQFNDQYNFNRKRPLSASIEYTNNDTYLQTRNRRSSSQFRNIPDSNRISEPEFTSESRGVFGRKRVECEYYWGLDSPSKSLTDNSDDGMDAYRVSSYTPKVIPFEKASFSRKASSGSNSKSTFTDHVALNPMDRKERSTSLRSRRLVSGQNPDLGSSPSRRRFSLTDSDKLEFTSEDSVSTSSASNTRLSELEKRIQENKKRREELLAGKPSTEERITKDTPVIEEKSNQTDQMIREATPASGSSKLKGSKLTRPSRLESMEARIKRKSYCVRVGCSPDRGQSKMSLEKWRQSSATLTNSKSPHSSRRSSLTGIETGSLSSGQRPGSKLADGN